MSFKDICLLSRLYLLN
uniref:Uncharacterized protein n=1 Tax=Anguilla anguilla TaxID=7936 RepID=A0A0E9VYZ4_ANGAN